MSSAQDEFNQILQHNRDKFSVHPEDRNNSSDRDSDSSNDDDDDGQHISNPPSNDEDNDSTMRSRTGSYRVPNTVYDANTGPKGVIADAQAFERARKQSFRKTLGGTQGISDDANLLNNSPPPDGTSAKDSDDEESRFMRKWRESRMQKLQSQTFRRSSPRRRVYGTVDVVDAAGYLDAIEKVTSDTVVVVCVYDPEVIYLPLPYFPYFPLPVCIQPLTSVFLSL